MIDPKEWLRQSEYDFDTAKYMYNGSRFSYTVFMCHLSVEKALKGLYSQRLNDIPPKTHNLIYLLGKMNIKPQSGMSRILVKLNEANIAARYPENLEIVGKNYTETIVKELIENTEEALKWIRSLYSK